MIVSCLLYIKKQTHFITLKYVFSRRFFDRLHNVIFPSICHLLMNTFTAHILKGNANSDFGTVQPTDAGFKISFSQSHSDFLCFGSNKGLLKGMFLSLACLNHLITHSSTSEFPGTLTLLLNFPFCTLKHY